MAQPNPLQELGYAQGYLEGIRVAKAWLNHQRSFQSSEVGRNFISEIVARVEVSELAARAAMLAKRQLAAEPTQLEMPVD